MGGYTVGIHIRRTDNIKSIQNSPTELFTERMDMEIFANAETKFFISTDSPDEEKRLLDRYGDRIIVQGIKELSRNSRDGIRAAAVDLGCLSLCDKIYGSYWSSFSQTAANLNGKKELIILTK